MLSIEALPTVSEAKLIIDNNYQRFLDKKFISPLSLDIIGYAVANEVQLRDYLIGFTVESNDFMTAFEYLAYLAENVAENHRTPFNAVLALYQYEVGLTADAMASLEKCLVADPSYSLALLVVRVIRAGWSPESVQQMRDGLHSKIVEAINEIANQKITAETLA
jgi:hypothetical protein